MNRFEDLTPVQQEALTDAFGHPDSYEGASLSQIDDYGEASRYDAFQDTLEGEIVSKGDMPEEKIESYKDIGFLRDGEEGLEINSVWDDWQVAALEENNMFDFNRFDVYVTEASDTPEVAVVTDKNTARLDIGDSLRYEVEGFGSRSEAEQASDDRIEDLSQEFIEFFTGEESDDFIYRSKRSKSRSSTQGGENNMTEDTADFEFSGEEVRHAGSLEHYENEDEYGELEQDEIEALGTALYVEEVVSGERDDTTLDDVAGYIAGQDEFNFGAMVEYKANLGGRDYDQFVDGVNDVVSTANNLTQEVEAKGAIFEGLAREVQNDRDQAHDAIGGIMDAVSGLQRDSDWLDQAADLQDAEQQEQEAADTFSDLEGKLEDL